MNLAAKTISSPGRPEKYPPPLMRFLRSNAASKSRGKSRSNSPMFFKKNNNEPQQEPTSPKVTCIGQVRSKARAARVRPESTRRCSCWKLKKPKAKCFCPNLGKIPRPRLVKPNWRKWGLFFRSGYCRKTEIRNDSVKREDEEEEIPIEENVESMEDFVPTCPPKNALLLTRCRSTPYRSSSLASRFWAISETGEKTEDLGNERENRGRAYEQLEKGETEDPISETKDLGNSEENLGDVNVIEGLIGTNSEEKEDNLGNLKVIGDLISRKSEEIEDNLGNLKVIGGLIGRKSEEMEAKVIKGLISRKSEEIAQNRDQPVVLMRCKSEPARTGETGET